MHFSEQVLLDATNVQVTRDGYLVANPRVARTGIQLYSGDEMGMPDKAMVRVYRSESEVFSQDAMRSLAHRPVTNGHPPEFVNASNWRQHAIDGSGGDIARDGDCIRVPLVLMDATAIADVQAGKVQLRSVTRPRSSRAKARRRPARSTMECSNIRANHVALVSRARGGSRLRIGDSTMDDNKYVVTDEQQRKVDEAYFEYCQQLNNAWRGKDNPPPAVVPNDTPERAYGEMREAIQHAWKRGAR